ncbi:VOC family protein [Mesorhizobium sp. Z1-4]|uniref:VOC family protein n=1 Tax=Mesorhizobium sp. Z1-4 TaxID=2448478 RepID=UPI000FDB7B94|nr:VOC family protein [Mesorhizobium sp. Z1-4]
MAGFIPQNAVVWAELPVSDMARAKAFYSAVVGNELKDQEGGPNPMSIFVAKESESIGGNIYPGNPAPRGTGPTVHLAVDSVDAAMERVRANGGEVVSPVIELPAGRFAYCLDPDGNSIGVFSA